MRYEINGMINATPDAVWSVLTDAAALASGNLGILNIEGEISLGSRIKLWAEVSPKRAFDLTVSELEPNKLMVWSSGMPLGLFKGVRQFRLSPHGDKTEFFMEEEFSGLLLPLIGKSIPDLQPSFEQFMKGLEELVTATVE